MKPLRLAVTADLHWRHRPQGDAATLALRDYLLANPPDVLLLGGDQGTVAYFGECLQQFADLKCVKALVPGNHDIWVELDDERGDSFLVYHFQLPRVCAEHGFHFLDHGPLVLPDSGLSIVGSMNWYDYSWSLERLKAEVPDWEMRVRTKSFTRGRHNDGRFVRWPMDDRAFTQRIVAKLELNLTEALAKVEKAVVLTHHPAFYGLSFARPGPPSVPDGLLWDAFCGNQAVENLLTRFADRIPFVFCGHIHRDRENALGPIKGYNIGGDYHFKRLLILDWPAGTVEAHVFGETS
jgi:predicted phosphohydrolase